MNVTFKSDIVLLSLFGSFAKNSRQPLAAFSKEIPTNPGNVQINREEVINPIRGGIYCMTPATFKVILISRSKRNNQFFFITLCLEFILPFHFHPLPPTTVSTHQVIRVGMPLSHLGLSVSFYVRGRILGLRPLDEEIPVGLLEVTYAS